jgi:hypothetical protein
MKSDGSQNTNHYPMMMIHFRIPIYQPLFRLASFFDYQITVENLMTSKGNLYFLCLINLII